MTRLYASFRQSLQQYAYAWHECLRTNLAWPLCVPHSTATGFTAVAHFADGATGTHVLNRASAIHFSNGFFCRFVRFFHGLPQKLMNDRRHDNQNTQTPNLQIKAVQSFLRFRQLFFNALITQIALRLVLL